MIDVELYKKVLYFNSRTNFTYEEIMSEIGVDNLLTIFTNNDNDNKIKNFLEQCIIRNISPITPEFESRIDRVLKEETITEDFIKENFTFKERVFLVISSNYLCEKLIDRCQDICFFTDTEAISLLQHNIIDSRFDKAVNSIKNDKLLIPFIKQWDIDIIKKIIRIRKESLSEETTEAIAEATHILKTRDYNLLDRYIKFLSINQKMKIINNHKDIYLISRIIITLPTSEKLKHLNKAKKFRTDIIKSIEEDEIKIKFIRSSRDKGEIIASIKDDGLKEILLLKFLFYLKMNGESLGKVIASFKDDRIIDKYWFLLKSESSKVGFIQEASMEKKKYCELLFDSLRKKESIIDCSFVLHGTKKTEFIKKTNNQDILENLFNFLDDENNHLIFQKLSERRQENIVKNVREVNPTIFCFYVHLDNSSFLYESILHTAHYPEYNPKYDALIIRIAKYKNVNANRLLKLARVFGMAVLSKIENTNIANLLRVSNEHFAKIMAFFSKEMISFDENNQNDALNAIIHRKFVSAHSEDILIFTETLHAIKDNNHDVVIQIIDKINQIVSIERFNTSKKNLINGLLANDSKTIELYNKITNEYIRILRANFDIEEKGAAEVLYKDKEYDKYSLAKYVMKRFDISEIIEKIEEAAKDAFPKKEFTSEEKKLIANRELLKRVLEFKKDPKNYKEEVTNEIKENIKMTEEIIKKAFSYYQFDTVKNKRNVKESNKSELLEILCELNVEQLVTTVLNDEVKNQELLDLLKKRKIPCWLGRFDELAYESDTDLCPSVIASLLANYSEVRKIIFKEESIRIKTIIQDFRKEYDKDNIKLHILEAVKEKNKSKSDLVLTIEKMAQQTKINLEKLIEKLINSAEIYKKGNFESALNILNPEIKSLYTREQIEGVFDKINKFRYRSSYEKIIKPSPINPSEKEIEDLLNLIDQLHDNVPELETSFILENLFDSAIIYNNIGIEEGFSSLDNRIRNKLSNDKITDILTIIIAFINKTKKSNLVSSTFIIDVASIYDISSQKLRILIGKEVYDQIKRNPAPNQGSLTSKERMDSAIKLIRQMHERKYITVPPSSEIYDLSSKKRIKISVGDLHSFENLIYGEITGSCMRIGGAGYSLFKFCLNNENGFHVKFTDPETDKLVSRVSGFRNGNTVFLNELRYSLSKKYSNENIVTACRLFAKKLIKASKDSRYPIENVVITPTFAMEQHANEIQDISGINTQQGLDHFYTDITSRIIVLASTNPDNSLVPIKTSPNNAERYKSLRREVKRLAGPEAYRLKYQIKLLEELYSGRDYQNIEIDEKAIVYAIQGEDWYVVVDSNGQIESYIMETSHDKQKAASEMGIELEKLKKIIETYGIEQIQLQGSLVGMK